MQGTDNASGGLGVAEILAPRFVLRLVGGDGRHTNLIRLYGLRELVSGLMIFGQGSKPAAAVWSHRMRLDDAPEGYALFSKKQDDCIKVVLTP